MNTIKMKLLPLFLLLPFIAFTQDEFFQKGQKLQLSGNWNEAIEYYKVVLAKNPNNEKAIFNHAICAMNLDKMGIVKKDINKLLSINQDHWEAIEWRGAIALNEERWKDAIDDFDLILEDDEIFEVRLNRAIAYLENNQLDLCKKDLDHCKKEQPYHAKSNAILGDFYLKNGNLPKALAAYKKSLETKPNNPIVLNNCGIIATRENRFDEAIDYFKSASDLEPRSDFYAHLALAYLEKENLGSAATYAKLAISKNFNESRAHFALGMINFKKEIHEEAIEDFNVAIEADSKYKDAYLMRAKANIELALTLAAKVDLKEVLRLEPENSEAKRLLKD